MVHVYIADHRAQERYALRLLLADLEMDLVGESGDWASTIALVPSLPVDMLLVEWELLPHPSSVALDELRKRCSPRMVVVLISRLEARQQAAISSGADSFISKNEVAERVSAHLQAVASGIHSKTSRSGGDATK